MPISVRFIEKLIVPPRRRIICVRGYGAQGERITGTFLVEDKAALFTAAHAHMFRFITSIVVL